MDEVTTRTVQYGAHRLRVLDAGPLDGPVVLLLHGLASDSGTWSHLLPLLGRRGVRALAPDLLGHGSSDKPRQGYTLAGFTESLRSLQADLGLPAVVVVGHSFGGAVAMHYAHHEPQAVRGLVLVSAGGLGKRVHPILRAAAVRGSDRVLGLVINARTRRLLALPALHRALRLRPEAIVNLRRIGNNIVGSDSRRAFFATLRHVISPSGQRGSMIQMRYLEHGVPTMIVWSEHDPVIPVSHARDLHDHLEHSRLELFPGASHEPHRRHPERFADALCDFLARECAAR